MSRPKTIALLVWIALGSAAPAAADFASERAKLDAALVPRLEELAERCEEVRLLGSRDRCYRTLLALDPEHKAARRVLRYRFTKGEWKQAGSYREPKDLDEDALAEVGPAIESALANHREALLELLGAHEKELGLVGIEATLDHLVALDPDSSALRERIGEVLFEGEWVLAETVRSKERHAAIAESARTVQAAVPLLEVATPNGWETKLGVQWAAAFRSDRVRVLGTVEADELRAIARASHATEDLFAMALGKRIRLPADFALYVVPFPGERETLVGNLGPLDGNRRDVLLAGYGGWLGYGEVFGEWSPEAARRIDTSARQAIGRMLRHGYQISLDHGWAWEGFGVYLVEAMLGTRLTWYAKTTRYAPDGSSARHGTLDLHQPDADWAALGRELLLGDGAPSMSALIARPVSEMGSRDLLFSYMLATYLLEGRPDETPLVLTSIGQGMHPIQAFEESLGASLPRIDRRFRRWLRESAPTEH